MPNLSLHIGLNILSAEYRGNYRRLIAAENDATDMCSIAEAQGFAATRLLSADATRERVIDEIKSAYGQLQSGDVFLLTFSGHGTAISNEDHREASGYDAKWCFYNSPIKDDDLTTLMKCFKPGVEIIVISDSCNTGTIIDTDDEVKADSSVGSGSLAYDEHGTIKWMMAQVAMARLQEYEMDNPGQIPNIPKDKKIDAKVLVISASQDIGPNGHNSPSYDATRASERNSKFTGVLLEVWQNRANRNGYWRFFQKMNSKIKDLNFKPGRMSPCIYCYLPEDRPFWDAKEALTW